ncbi:MAG: class I tRNA ligase family protein [Nanoarchaeota archaeon]
MEKPYFTTIIAFSTPSGRLHIGHALGQVAGDVASRYAELQGKKTFFPFGIHSTGKDLIRILNEIKPENERFSERRRNYDLSDKKAQSILSKGTEESQVNNLIQHFREKYTSDLINLGINIDRDSFFATDEPSFHKYTQWSIRKLAEAGLIGKTKSPRPYCPQCDDIKAIESDFSEVFPLGKVNLDSVRIQEGNVLFFKNQNLIVPVYTTRPETIFGVTNLFFNPNKNYLEAEVNGRRIITEEGSLEEIIYSLFDNPSIKVKGRVNDLETRRFVNPVTEEEIPILPADFVRSGIGTGIVMSVPIHDPFDYFFLRRMAPELLKEAKTVIVDSKGNPVSFNYDELSEKELEEIRKTTYNLQEQGEMAESSVRYAGQSVPIARSQLMKDLQEKDIAGQIFKILGGEFFCRLHKDQRIVVKSSEENSIDYGNLEYQERTIEFVRGMKLFPPKYRSELEEIILTRRAKPCERKAEGNIGALSPLSQDKRIEALADSNIYMEYYGIALALNREILRSENLNDLLFDYLLLHKGDPKEVARISGLEEEKLSELKLLMNERYPININIAATEHKDVHFPFSLFIHSAILPEELFPREYLLTSHVMLEGEKMSKSRGNVLYLDNIINFVKENPIEGVSEEASLDSIRFFLMSYQSLDRDFDWSQKLFVSSGLNRLQRYISFVKNNLRFKDFNIGSPRLETDYDKWMMTKLQRAIIDSTSAMESRRFREATIHFDGITKDVQRYISSEKSNEGLTKLSLTSQLSILYPFAPRISNELHQSLFRTPILTWPICSSDMEFPEEHDQIEHKYLGKKYIDSLIGALRRSIGVAKGKGLYDESRAEVVFPSNYSLELSRQEGSLASLLGNCDIEVATGVRIPYIKQEGIIF